MSVEETGQGSLGNDPSGQVPLAGDVPEQKGSHGVHYKSRKESAEASEP